MAKSILRRKISARIAGGVPGAVVRAAFIISAAALAVTAANLHFKPLIRELALTRLHAEVARAVNDAVISELANGGGEYDDLIVIEKDGEGEIAAVRADVVKMNQMKSGVMAQTLASVKQIDKEKIGVPVGSLFGGTLLYGDGPKLPVSVLSTIRTDAAFVSEFTEAGVNQTRYRILIEVAVDLGVQLPGERTSIEAVTQVPVAELVLVGRVPENYTYIDDTENGLIGKINDHKGGGS